jgi:hypothetical protein
MKTVNDSYIVSMLDDIKTHSGNLDPQLLNYDSNLMSPEEYIKYVENEYMRNHPTKKLSLEKNVLKFNRFLLMK